MKNYVLLPPSAPPSTGKKHQSIKQPPSLSSRARHKNNCALLISSWFTLFTESFKNLLGANLLLVLFPQKKKKNSFFDFSSCTFFFFFRPRFHFPMRSQRFLKKKKKRERGRRERKNKKEKEKRKGALLLSVTLLKEKNSCHQRTQNALSLFSWGPRQPARSPPPPPPLSRPSPPPGTSP